MESQTALVQTSSSIRFASVLLEAWDRADLSGVQSHLAESDRLDRCSDASTLEAERWELVSGIAASLKDALKKGARVLSEPEVDASLQLLRHVAGTR